MPIKLLSSKNDRYNIARRTVDEDSRKSICILGVFFVLTCIIGRLRRTIDPSILFKKRKHWSIGLSLNIHMANALSAVIIVVICISVRCDLAEDALSSKAAPNRAAETKLIMAAGTTIFQSASLAQLNQLIVDVPRCYKKKGATVQSRIGPLLTALGAIFGKNSRSTENAEQSESKPGQVQKRCSAKNVNLLNEYFGKFLAKLTVTQLVTVRKVAQKTAGSNSFFKQAYLFILLPAINVCAKS